MDTSTDHGLSVLWASDGSPECLKAAGAIGSLLLPATRELTVLSVAPLGTLAAPLSRMLHRADGSRQAHFESASQAARLTVSALACAGVQARLRLAWGSAHQEILREADDCEADLIVLCNRWHGQLHNAVLHGTAQSPRAAGVPSSWSARRPASPPDP